MRSSLRRAVPGPVRTRIASQFVEFRQRAPSQLLRPLRGHVDVQKPALDGWGRLPIGFRLVRCCFSDVIRFRDVIEKPGVLVHATRIREERPRGSTLSQPVRSPRPGNL